MKTRRPKFSQSTLTPARFLGSLLWQAALCACLSAPPLTVRAQNGSRDEQGSAPAPGGKDAARPMPAQVDEQIQKLAFAERKKRMDFMGVVIEDVSRLCRLDETQQKRLNLAAKGAAERSMKTWHEQAQRYFSSRLKGANSDTAKEILANIGSVSFGGRDAEQESESESLWKDALKDVLTKEQIAQYEEVVEQRRQEKVDAYAEISLASLDNYLRLTPNQRKQLRVLVQDSANEYLDEVQRYWGNYFENGMLMSLANAAEDEELKKILTEKQFERHKAATANFEHFWDQKRKLRKAKARAAEKRKTKADEKDGEKSDANKKDDQKPK